ncbi:MAG: hypothetical protein ACXWP1_01835, partial [Bdellovibrionota bacterium]
LETLPELDELVEASVWAALIESEVGLALRPTPNAHVSAFIGPPNKNAMLMQGIGLNLTLRMNSNRRVSLFSSV